MTHFNVKQHPDVTALQNGVFIFAFLTVAMKINRYTLFKRPYNYRLLVIGKSEIIFIFAFNRHLLRTNICQAVIWTLVSEL